MREDIEMGSQISMFDGETQFKITKPLRLIELFGGYGSQSLALKYLGVPFESIGDYANGLYLRYRHTKIYILSKILLITPLE